MQNRITLDEVKQSFEQWRAVKRHQRESAPKKLRAQVMAIAPYYSRQQIIKELAINQEQMNRYVAGSQFTELRSMPDMVPSNEFIELAGFKLSKQEQQPTLERVLTITRADGSQWIISEVTQDVISESLRLFLRG